MHLLIFSIVAAKLIYTPKTEQVCAEAQETVFPEKGLAALAEAGCEWARYSSKHAPKSCKALIFHFLHMPYVPGCNTAYLVLFFFPPVGSATKETTHFVKSLNL